MKNKWLTFPYILWIIIFTVIPIFIVIYYASTIVDENGLRLSFANFAAVFDRQAVKMIWLSIRTAAVTTVVCFVLGYPAAYIMSSSSFKKRNVLIFLFVAPMWMNTLLRTYAWISLFETNGAFNNALGYISDIINKISGSGVNLHVDISYTVQLIYVGMVYNFITFMILPIYTVLIKIDQSLVESAQDLGANPIRVFLKVKLPLSIPGIISGVTMVFMPAVTTFVITDMLGGGKFMMIGNQIESYFLRYGNWRLGSSLSIVLMIIVLISISILSAVDKNKEKDARESGALF